MGKLLKVVFGIVGALLLIVVLAVGAFALFFDPNDFRSQITTAAKKATGRDLTVGDIKASFFPTLGARVKAVSLSNATGFGDAPMAEVAEADVGLGLMALVLKREIKVGKVTLNGLKLNLAKDASGKSNWDDFVGGKKDADKPDDTAGKGSGIKSIDISGIVIKDANIAYVDQQTKQAYGVSGLNLETGSIKPGDPFDLKLAFSTTVKEPAAKADVKLSTRIEYDLAAQKYSAEKLVLNVLATMPEQKADIELAGNIMADMAKQTALVDKLTVKVKAVMKDLSADVALSVGVSAELDKQIVRAEKIALKVDAEGKAVPGGKQTIDFSGDAIYDGAKGTMKLAGGDLKTAGLDATIALDGIGLNSDKPRFYGPISVKTFNPRELLKMLGKTVETHDPAVLKELSLRGKIDATPQSARITDLIMKLDQSVFTGSLGLLSFASQAAEFALKLDAIDADRYLPTPAAPTKAGPLTPAEKAAVNATELPAEALDGFTANGTVDIGKLKVSNLSMSNVQFRLNAARGAEKQIGLAAQLYGGSIASTTRIAPGASPRYAESMKLTSVAAGPLLLDFTGKESMTGEGNFALDVTGTGKTVGQLKQTLNGDMSFSFLNGAVKGFNLGQILRKGDAFLKGQQFNENEPVQTDFAELSATGKFTNGVLQSDALNAKSPLFRVDGAGKVNLVNETIDYTAKPTIVNTASGQGGKELPDLAGIIIPIRVTGTFDAPKYSLDLKAALQQKAAEGLREQLVGDKGDKLREKIDTQLEKKLGTQLDGNPALKSKITEGLNSLFGKKKPPPEPVPAPAPEPAPAPAPTP